MKTFDVKKFIDTTQSRSMNASPNSQGTAKVEDSPKKEEADKVAMS